MAVSDLLATDDLTILLGVVTASIFLLSNLYKPQSLVHPILLGRQSDVSRVRNPGESAVYRYYGTGIMGRFPIRPAREINTLLDHVKPEVDAPRTLWSTKITNSALRERVARFGTGLRRAGLKSSSNVLLLLNDGIEFLITDLALASQNIPSFTLSSQSLLAPVLEAHPPTAIIIDAGFLPHALELILDSAEASHHVLVVLGEPDERTVKRCADSIRLVRWSDIEDEGQGESLGPSSPPTPERVFSVSFYQGEDGQVHGAQLTHQNLTAGVTAVRALVPPSSPLTGLDTIVSAHSLSTAYGRSIAYTAVLEGCSFGTLTTSRIFKTDDSVALAPLADLAAAKKLNLPAPTVLFVTPPHLDALVGSVLAEAKKSLMFPIAWRHKLAAILEGSLTRESMWDRLVLNDARLSAGAATVRSVIVAGGRLPAASLTPARVALSVPVVFALAHPLSTAPLCATHPHDVQTFNVDDTAPAPVGPPVCNIEAKLSGVDDAAIEKGEDPVGTLLVRGPPIGKALVGGDDPVVEEVAGAEEPWETTGIRVRVQTNGSFVVLDSK
ncbi:acetyl-CoA synthetase-like protein [Peniophora sp. CONT]|nr:acetyl-CoA synthetase-like protein [Peniophora sp. CONT]